MNIIILKWVLTNFILLEVAQPDVTQTTVEILQSDWAATKDKSWHRLETLPPVRDGRAPPN